MDRLELPRAYPGIQSINYAEVVTAQELPAVTKRVLEGGADEFAVWPQGQRDSYVVNTLVEPVGGPNQRALGFDLSTESTRRAAMEQARDTGAVSLSGPINLVLDRAPQPRPAFLLLAPVYNHDIQARTVDQRRAAISGYVTAAFHLDELVSSVLRNRSLPLGAFVWDNLSARSGEPHLRHATRRRDARTSALGNDDRGSAFRAVGPVMDPSHRRDPICDPLAPGFHSAARAGRWRSSLSLLLFGISWSETSLRSRATKLARQMTEAVRKQAQLLDLTHDTVILRDHQNIIRYWNRAARDTYGFTSEEAIGHTADELLKTKFPLPLDALWEELGRNGRWDGELVHTKRDGTQILVASRWAVQRGADGEIESILETNNDITDQRRAEDDRRRLEASLLQAQKLEAMGTLAGGVAHDFNNILGAVLGYGELAQNAAPPGSSLRRYVDSMMSAGQRAKSLVERILAFSRSGVGPRTAVHVQSIVNEALEILSASLADNIRLETQEADGQPRDRVWRSRRPRTTSTGSPTARSSTKNWTVPFARPAPGATGATRARTRTSVP